jgi:protocatechuate 3,4-dioxygenase alpha subunit
VLTQYVTRLYLDGQPMNADDPILALVPADRRATLLAVPVSDREYRFDVVLQGANETVFFDV